MLSLQFFIAKVSGGSPAAGPGGGRGHRARPRAPKPRSSHPRAPTRAVGLGGRGRPLGRAWGARGLRRLRGGSSAEAQRAGRREDASVRGASPPSGHQSPDTSEIRLWVCGERNATQTPFSPKPRADKHAQARTQTWPPPALAAAGSGAREEPGDRTGSLPPPGSPGRGRSPAPLAGAAEVPGVTGPEQRRNGRSGLQPRRPGRGGSGRRTQLSSELLNSGPSRRTPLAACCCATPSCSSRRLRFSLARRPGRSQGREEGKGGSREAGLRVDLWERRAGLGLA